MTEDLDLNELEKRAAAGSLSAQDALGICYLEGFGVGKDYERALSLLSDAAERGAPRAIANLARMYKEGLGVSKNTSRAVELYVQAAEAGEFLAQVELGRIYSRGIGVSPNPREALKWYAAAIAQEAHVDNSEELREALSYVRQQLLMESCLLPRCEDF